MSEEPLYLGLYGKKLQRWLHFDVVSISGLLPMTDILNAVNQ